MLQENSGTQFDICSTRIKKAKAPLGKVVENLGKLGKGLAR
jgi:hypothetical protein